MKAPQNTDIPPIDSGALAAKLAASGMQDFVDGSMDAIISIDAQMRIVLFNPAASRIFGMSIEDAMGRPIEDFIPERFRGVHGSHVHNFGLHEHTSRKMGQGGQIFGLRANGEEFPAKASISQFEIDGHAVFNVFLRDVTNQVKIRKALDQSSTELEEANQMLTRTAAMARARARRAGTSRVSRAISAADRSLAAAAVKSERSIRPPGNTHFDAMKT